MTAKIRVPKMLMYTSSFLTCAYCSARVGPSGTGGAGVLVATDAAVTAGDAVVGGRLLMLPPMRLSLMVLRGTFGGLFFDFLRAIYLSSNFYFIDSFFTTNYIYCDKADNKPVVS